MARLVFDIETIGKSFEQLDEKSQHDLLRSARTDEERAAEKERLALYPVSGEVIAIGMHNVDTQQGCVLYQNAGGTQEEEERDGVRYASVQGERELLVQFWEAAAHYDQFITFNGRGFDVPYLLVRGAAHDVVPTKNLMPYRYESRVHCDLADQLTFFGASRRFSLHLYATALGIESPKDAGVDGLAVPRLYAEGKYKEIAAYCMRDVIATSALFEKWQKYIAPQAR